MHIGIGENDIMSIDRRPGENANPTDICIAPSRDKGMLCACVCVHTRKLGVVPVTYIYLSFICMYSGLLYTVELLQEQQ